MLGDVAWKAARYYVVFDFVLGPVYVGGIFAGFALFIFGTASSWYYGVPWPISMTAVGVAWAGIAVGLQAFTRWTLRWVRNARATAGPH